MSVLVQVCLLCVCLSVYVSVCLCMFVYVSVSVSLSVYVCLHFCLSVCVCLSTCLSVCLCMSVCVCLCMSVCLCVCVCLCMCVQWCWVLYRGCPTFCVISGEVLLCPCHQLSVLHHSALLHNSVLPHNQQAVTSHSQSFSVVYRHLQFASTLWSNQGYCNLCRGNGILQHPAFRLLAGLRKKFASDFHFVKLCSTVMRRADYILWL